MEAATNDRGRDKPLVEAPANDRGQDKPSHFSSADLAHKKATDFLSDVLMLVVPSLSTSIRDEFLEVNRSFH